MHYKYKSTKKLSKKKRGQLLTFEFFYWQCTLDSGHWTVGFDVADVIGEWYVVHISLNPIILKG